MTEATSNSSGEIKIFSEIKYFFTGLNSDIQILCEISYSSTCGTGLAASNITLHSVGNAVDTRKGISILLYIFHFMINVEKAVYISGRFFLFIMK